MIKVGMELFDGALKCVQVQISSNSTPALELENKWEASGSWEEDWEALVSKALQVNHRLCLKRLPENHHIM